MGKIYKMMRNIMSTCTAAAAAGRTAGAGPASARGGTAAGRPPRGTPASAPAHTTAPPAPAPAPALHLDTLLPRHVLAHLPRHHAATTRGYLYQWLYAFKCNAFHLYSKTFTVSLQLRATKVFNFFLERKVFTDNCILLPFCCTI